MPSTSAHDHPWIEKVKGLAAAPACLALVWLSACRNGGGGGGAGGANGGQPASPVPTAHGPINLRVDPLQGTVGSEVTVTLSGVEGTPGIAFGTARAEVKPLGSDRFLVRVPPEAKTAPVAVSLGREVSVTPLPFRVVQLPPGPHLLSLSPRLGPVGTAVTLRGTGFGAVTAVSFADTRAKVQRRTDSELEVLVPEGTHGWAPIRLEVAHSGDPIWTHAFFAALARRFQGRLESLSPEGGPAGTVVTLRYPDSGIESLGAVFFGDVQARIRKRPGPTFGTSEVQATVPAGARTGPVRLFPPCRRHPWSVRPGPRRRSAGAPGPEVPL